MASTSLQAWNNTRCEALNEIENAHASVGGTGRGRRYATQQINFAYAALVSAHFQGFCRDLHSECVEHITLALPATFQTLVRIELLWNRSLSKGNPHPGAIGSDFNRLGFDFWEEVYAINGRNERRREMLQELVDWRNAIAHQDFDAVSPGAAPSLQLVKVKSWRIAVSALARHFDLAMYNYLTAKLGVEPWSI